MRGMQLFYEKQLRSRMLGSHSLVIGYNAGAGGK